MKQYEPIVKLQYGPLNAKVSLLPDFFTNFVPERRAEIVAEEAAFYGKYDPASFEASPVKKAFAKNWQKKNAAFAVRSTAQQTAQKTEKQA